MRRKSEFTRLFANALMDIKERGDIDILVEKFHDKCTDNTKMPGEKPLGYEKLTFLFIILISGFILSLFVISFELRAQKIQKKLIPVTTSGKILKLTIITDAEQFEKILSTLCNNEIHDLNLSTIADTGQLEENLSTLCNNEIEIHDLILSSIADAGHGQLEENLSENLSTSA